MARARNTICICTAIMLAMCLTHAQGAEDEGVLLSIEGDLIGLSDVQQEGSVANREEALRLVHTYHQLLSDDLRAQIESLHQQILSLIPDFQVAYAAADSAEITDVMSEIDLRLAAMQEIHAQEYTQAVVRLLTQAYQMILPGLDD